MVAKSGCPHTSHPAASARPRWAPWVAPAAGFLSLIWFVVRVAPKPSRAAYPCQRAALPLASGFVLWAGAVLSSALLYRKGIELCRRPRVLLACACLALAAVFGIGALLTSSLPNAQATPIPNQPIGVAQGLNPGRVLWVHDARATKWEGPGHGRWWESRYTDQAVVNAMLSAGVRRLAGKSTDAEAWDALLKYFNRTHGNGDVGYGRGEKITIKVNLVGCIIGGGVDPSTHELVRELDYMNTSPQMIVALLGQLVKVVGVNQQDIAVGDPLSLFPNQFYQYCSREFPDVRYLDHDGGDASHPRTQVRLSSVPLFWSSRPAGKIQDYVPVQYAEAKYLINMANLKAHTGAGVTLCAKNHFGSLFRTPPQKGYYDMHGSLPSEVPNPGHYRAVVDLMGHAQLGGKTLLYFIDGLYPGVHPIESAPRRWSSAPFNGHWGSSLLASQDPVAIDSVAFDFLWAEFSNYPRMSGADDYLHEAALANHPASGTFYDPDHATNTTRLPSLGAHEHWNNSQARQYSRNLGTGNGIELVQSEGSR